MDHKEARKFLLAHQPLLLDDILDNQPVFDDVGRMIEFYASNPCNDNIPLLFGFMDSCGEASWDENLQRALLDHSARDRVIEEINKALTGDREGRAIWAAGFTWCMTRPEVLDICTRHHTHSSESVREILSHAMEWVGTRADIAWIRQWLEREDDEETREGLTNAIEAINERDND